MRKAFLGTLAAVIVLSTCATTAFAAGPAGGRYFVDADGDGICDNFGSMCMYADADGDGICDSCGMYHWCSMAGTGCGRNFVDTDGDGVCDNYLTGQGRGNGRGNGTQGGRYFADADGDGVCDNYVPGQGRGGYGCGGRCGNGGGRGR